MCTEESLAVKVPKKQGEQVRLLLRDLSLLRTDLKIKKDKEYLFIPLHQDSKQLPDFDVVAISLQKIKQKPTSYQELLDIPKDMIPLLPSSFDVIGDILLLRLPEELHKYSECIGDALLKTQAHVKTICLISPVSGSYRTRKISVIAGEKKTVTQHKEYGLWFTVDVEKTYFSPRLASERKRVSDLVKKDASVFDMFCGVAPFSIMIARYALPAHILAIDKNPVAVELAKRNVKKNKVEQILTIINDDARNSRQILTDHEMSPDHIIMNLPFSAVSFFPLAVQCIADQGMIYYYDILEETKITKRCEELERIANTENTMIDQMRVHRIKTYGPHEFYIGIDITVSKK